MPSISKKLFLISLIIAFFLSSQNFAYALTLDSIGALSTGSSKYNEWWYTGSNPTLTGTAGADSSVVVKVGETSQTVTADSSGNWSYAMSTESTDPSVSITADGETYTFALHLGQDMPTSVGSTAVTDPVTGAPEVPATGYSQIAALSILVTFTLFGLLLSRKSRKIALRSFEKDITSSI